MSNPSLAPACFAAYRLTTNVSDHRGDAEQPDCSSKQSAAQPTDAHHCKSDEGLTYSTHSSDSLVVPALTVTVVPAMRDLRADEEARARRQD